MKRFFLFFLTCQIFLISIIYNKNFYDIYALNNVVSKDLNNFSVEDVSEESLINIYESITQLDNGILTIVKMPSTSDGIQRSNVYSNSQKGYSGIKPVAENKIVKYYDLTKEEFIDSTGDFYTNLTYSQINELIPNINIKAIDRVDVSYAQVFKMNIINFVVLIVVTQIIMFIYTFLRIKVNSVKKLLGYSSFRMISDSLKDFLKYELIATGIVGLWHIVYYIISRNVQFMYFVGLIVVILVVILINIFMLYITQISIKMINISDMIKNKVYSKVWERTLIITKIVMLLLVMASVSVFTRQYKEVKEVNNKIEEFQELSNYYTGRGMNADEYNKCIKNKKMHKEKIINSKKMYNNNKNKFLLAEVSLEKFSDAKERHLGMTFDEALKSYKINTAFMNINYFNKYMNILDQNGVKVEGSRLIGGTILIPEMYKNNIQAIEEIKDSYDNNVIQARYYGIEDIVEKPGNKNIIFIKNNQETNILSKFNLEGNRKIVNSIIYIEDGDLSGSYYLDVMSRGEMSMFCEDRGEFAKLLKYYDLDKLITEGTLLNELSVEIRNYEFLMEQSIVFAFIFSMTLVFIIFVTNYMTIMVNRKKFAIRYLMGHSKFKVLNMYNELNMLLIVFGVLVVILRLNWIIYYIFVLIDMLMLYVLYKKYVEQHTLEGLKGE